jgi:hypothetical protein
MIASHNAEPSLQQPSSCLNIFDNVREEQIIEAK